jgi:putative transposase
LGKPDSLVTAHHLYNALGPDAAARMSAYRGLFQAHLDQGVLDQIRSASQTGTPLGNAYFRAKIEAKLQCKVGQARRGRPNKEKIILEKGL